MKEWKESDSIFLAEKAIEWDEEFQLSPQIGNQDSSALRFKAEQLIRFTESPNWIATAYEIARFNPFSISLPGMRADQDMFMFLTEQLLNQKDVKLDSLPTILDKYEYDMWEPVQMIDLFGSDDKCYIFEVRYLNFYYWNAIFAIRRVGGYYQLEKLQDWTVTSAPGFHVVLSYQSIGDTNSNGFAEFVVVGEAGWSGIPNYNASNLEIYEWSPTIETFDRYVFEIFSQYNDQGPGEGKWEFGSSNASGIQPLIITDYKYTRQQAEAALSGIGDLECPYLERQRKYLWDGDEYSVISEILVPPPAEPAKCRIDWALEAGYTNDDAMNILSSALSNWPEEIDQDWGPATRDFVRLQTGIWFELRGDGDTAVNVLQPLVDRPTDPNFPIFAQLTKIYLNKRSEVGVLGAFIKLEEEWDDAIKELPEYLMYVNLDEVRQQWGYAHDNWYRGIGDWFYMSEAIDAELSSQAIFTSQQLTDWLDRSGFSYLDIKPVDFNEDGFEDNLILQKDPDWPEQVNLYLFINTPSGMTFEYYDFVWVENEPVALTVRTFQPAQNSPFITVVQVNKHLGTFSIGNNYEVEEYLYENDVSDFVTSDRLDIHKVGQNSVEEKITYVWNPQSSTLELVPSYDFAAMEQEAKRLFFYEQDFPATIAFIEQFLEEAPPEPRETRSCSSDACEYQPAWYRPSLLYLLALAYELNGEPQKAIATYYQLWQDEPKTIFGIAASLKLELDED